jgi:hypothetical protein
MRHRTENRNGEMELPARFSPRTIIFRRCGANGAMALAEAKMAGSMGSVGAFPSADSVCDAYRSTLRFRGAAGEQIGQAQSTKSCATGKAIERPQFSSEIARVPEEAAALALASFRSMMRAPR